MISDRYSEILREFARRLKSAREAAGYQSAQLFAFAFGVEPHTYRGWERGDHAPDLKTLQRLCLVLDVTANDLLPVQGRDEKQ
jgi:transcriptional regulator with XRE-family HTH domain